MAYSEELADRIREIIDSRPGAVVRKTFGGVAWMVNGNMACGAIGEAGRSMRGFIPAKTSRG